MKIAVVGTCASGKSSIVAELRRRGYDAYVVSQEHSIVRNLWHHEQPDAVVVLEADFHTICQRRGSQWPRWLYDLQRERLRDARQHADLIVDTSTQSVESSVDLIANVLSLERWT